MHRPNLNNLSAEELGLLVELIQLYVTPEIVELHWNAVLSGVHNDPAGFLSFHRNYISGLEEYLTEQGHSQFVPLPAWNPVEPIPAEFNIPNTGPNRLQNLNPDVSFSPQFAPENLANFETVEELGAAIMSRHNLVHQRIGGAMNNLRLAPEAPIFWPFHAFIDDIWWTWQRSEVIVPSCIGITFGEAKKILEFYGLRSYHYSFNSLERIKFQRPAPLSIVARGSFIKLFL